MKYKFSVKKSQENVLQFMFLYIIRTPFRAQIGGEKCGLYTGKTVCEIQIIHKLQHYIIISMCVH